MLSILEKIKGIFNMHNMGGSASLLIPALCKDVADTLAREVLSGGPGQTKKQDDAIWDFFKSMSGEEQVFIINSVLHGLSRVHTLFVGKTQQEIEQEIEKAKTSLGISKEPKEEVFPIQIFDSGQK